MVREQIIKNLNCRHLAEFISTIADCSNCPHRYIKCHIDEENWYSISSIQEECIACWMAWLQEEGDI